MNLKKIKYLCLTLVLSFLLTVPAFASQPQFSDVTNRAVYAEAVTYLAESEIVNGTGNNRFQPNAKITTSRGRLCCAARSEHRRRAAHGQSEASSKPVTPVG